MFNLQKLQETAARRYEVQKARLREMYAYARSKGFSVSEAQILSFKSKEVIDSIYLEKLKVKR